MEQKNKLELIQEMMVDINKESEQLAKNFGAQLSEELNLSMFTGDEVRQVIIPMIQSSIVRNFNFQICSSLMWKGNDD